jgi:hypothetical protein
MDSENTSNKIQLTFIMKTLNKVVVEENFLNLTNGIYENPANIILTGKDRMHSHQIQEQDH